MAVVTLAVLLPGLAAAEPCRHAAVTQTGVAAPCDGVLWPAAWTAEALRDRHVRLPAARARAKHAASSAAADLEAARAQSAHDAAVAAAALEAEQARSRTWRELAEARAVPPATPELPPVAPAPASTCHRWLWAGLGVVAGAAAAVGVLELRERWR